MFCSMTVSLHCNCLFLARVDLVYKKNEGVEERHRNLNRGRRVELITITEEEGGNLACKDFRQKDVRLARPGVRILLTTWHTSVIVCVCTTVTPCVHFAGLLSRQCRAPEFQACVFLISFQMFLSFTSFVRHTRRYDKSRRTRSETCPDPVLRRHFWE